MIRICTSLAARYHVQLIGRQVKNSKPLVNQAFKQKRLTCFFNKGKLFYLEYNLRLLLFLLFQKTDAICAVDLDTLWPAYLVARLRGKKLIYDAHEYFTEVPEVVGRPFTQGVWRWTANTLISRTDARYTVGQALSAEFESQYKKTFEVVRNVPVLNTRVDFSNEKMQQKLAKPIVLYQGVLNRGRGLEEMIEAMTLLEGVEFWLAGEGDLSEMLRAKVEKMNLGKRVRFLGYVLPKDLSKITQQAALGYNVLQNEGLNYYYSLANKTFDYIHAGVPALHSNFPEYQELNSAYQIGVLVDELKPSSLAHVIKGLLADSQKYKQLRLNCSKAKEVLNWEKESQNLLSIYQQLLDNNR